MYRTIKDFMNDWKYESESTLKVFNNLTRESLKQKVNPEGRSLGKIAWHITLANPEMLVHSGLLEGDFNQSSPVPDNPEVIVKEYNKMSEIVSKTVAEKWKDKNLTDEINMYGQVWTKGAVLKSLIFHQAHHRAQMTVLMRQAGLKVPGIYGPAKEEWETYGMKAEE